MAQQLVATDLDEELQSVLKINGKGWSIQLFDDQSKLDGCLCASCKYVCDAASELDCEHDVEEEILVYCHDCLQQLITDNDWKCPINAHENPVIARNRVIRSRIARLIVICPYSTTVGCAWKGTLCDLTSKHITECAKTTRTTNTNDACTCLLHKSQIQALHQTVAEKTAMIESLQHQLNEHTIKSAKKENESVLRILALQNQVWENEKRVSEISELNGSLQSKMDRQALTIKALQLQLKQYKSREKRLRSEKHSDKVRSEFNSNNEKRVSFSPKSMSPKTQQAAEEEKALDSEKPKQRKLDAARFAFNQQPKSEHIQIPHRRMIRNTHTAQQSVHNYHSVTFGAVIACGEHKRYRLRFKLNKMKYSFVIGFAGTRDDLKAVAAAPGSGANKASTTGVYVSYDNHFYLYDKYHETARRAVADKAWSGWYDKRKGFEFVMEFDFERNAFVLYWKRDRKLLQIDGLPKKSVVPIFSLLNKDDEIEIVECLLT